MSQLGVFLSNIGHKKEEAPFPVMRLYLAPIWNREFNNTDLGYPKSTGQEAEKDMEPIRPRMHFTCAMADEYISWW